MIKKERARRCGTCCYWLRLNPVPYLMGNYEVGPCKIHSQKVTCASTGATSTSAYDPLFFARHHCAHWERKDV